MRDRVNIVICTKSLAGGQGVKDSLIKRATELAGHLGIKDFKWKMYFNTRVAHGNSYTDRLRGLSDVDILYVASGIDKENRPLFAKEIVDLKLRSGAGEYDSPQLERAVLNEVTAIANNLPKLGYHLGAPLYNVPVKPTFDAEAAVRSARATRKKVQGALAPPPPWREMPYPPTELLNQPQEEIKMSNQKIGEIEVRTLIINKYGNSEEIGEVSDSDLLDLVSKLAREKKELEEIKDSSTLITARIKEIEETIARIDEEYTKRGSKSTDKAS